MGQLCEKCGEELIGNVNRCWRCGTTYEIVANLKEPPVRRSPVVLKQDQAGAKHQITQPLVLDYLRVPFLGTRWTARASVVTGCLACLVAAFSGWAIVVSMLALWGGLSGIQGKQDRETATLGIALSIVSVFLGVARIAIRVWTGY